MPATVNGHEMRNICLNQNKIINMCPKIQNLCREHAESCARIKLPNYVFSKSKRIQQQNGNDGNESNTFGTMYINGGVTWYPFPVMT